MKCFFTDIRTDSRGHQKGSVSVEAGLVFPLFFFCIMLFLRLFLLIMTECFVAETVCGLGKNMAAVSYGERALLKEKVTAPSLLCYPELFAQIGKNKQIENLRIICLDDRDKNVEISIFYDFPIQAPGFPGFRIAVKQTFLIHPYIGVYDKDKLVKQDEEDKEADESTVYITENGKVYHLSRTCSYLFMPAEEVDYSSIGGKRNLSGARYYPCEKCKNARMTGKVYITAYGNRYHLQAKCSALFRDVKEVDKSQVGDRRPCSKCGER